MAITDDLIHHHGDNTWLPAFQGGFFLDQVEQRDELRPTWWDGWEKRVACERQALEVEGGIDTPVTKADIIEKYNGDRLMPTRLKMLAKLSIRVRLPLRSNLSIARMDVLVLTGWFKSLVIRMVDSVRDTKLNFVVSEVFYAALEEIVSSRRGDKRG